MVGEQPCDEEKLRTHQGSVLLTVHSGTSSPGHRLRPQPKSPIAHDYLTQRGGAEKVVISMSKAFPDAPVYTTLYDPESTYPEFENIRVIPSKLNVIGPLRHNHRMGLPLFPLISRTIRIDADIVITSSSVGTRFCGRVEKNSLLLSPFERVVTSHPGIR